MKNLIEELQKLDIEEDINVPSDFKEKVMNRIEKDSGGNIIKLKYIIPILSSAAVILIAVIFVGKTGRLESINLNDSTMMVADGTVVESYEDNRIAPSATGTNNSIFDMYDSIDNSVVAESKGESAISKDFSRTDFYSEIADMFKTNDIEANVEGSSVKAKCTKLKAEEVLFYYEGQITITTEGEYVIVK